MFLFCLLSLFLTIFRRTCNSYIDDSQAKFKVMKNAVQKISELCFQPVLLAILCTVVVIRPLPSWVHSICSFALVMHPMLSSFLSFVVPDSVRIDYLSHFNGKL